MQIAEARPQRLGMAAKVAAAFAATNLIHTGLIRRAIYRNVQ